MSARLWLSAGVYVVWFFGKAVGDCPLPQHPAHGHHQPQGGDCGGANRSPACDGTPGTLAPEDWLLSVHCDPGYQPPDPDASDIYSVCTNGEWSIPQLPKCVIPDLLTNDHERCSVPNPPPNSQYRLLAEECGGESLPPGSPVPHDCILFLNCVPGYRRRMGSGDVITYCSNKTWNPHIPDDLCIRDAGSGKDPIVRPTQQPSTTPTSVVSVNGCMLPEATATRKFCSLNPGCENCDFYNTQCFVPPGARVRNVKVVCAPGYSIRSQNGGDLAFCQTTGWYPPIPQCIKLCRALKSDELLLKCRIGADIVDCSKPAMPGTTVTLQCQPSFSEYPDLKRQGAYRTITCSGNGEWSKNLPTCKPACGISKEVRDFRPTIFNGTSAKIGLFPWHAGLYYRADNHGRTFWDQRCGGSLITNRVVITAAHCVGDVTHVSDLRVALGKFYRSWDSDEPTQAKRNVSDFIFPPQYIKSTLTFDIALVLLSERIQFGRFIMPVCRDFDDRSNEFRNTNLYVVGWGKTDSQIHTESSSTLLYNTVAAMPDNECRKAVPVFYNTFEKICAIKNNSESVTQGGDSGGGVTAVYRDGLHYLVGIVSSRVDNLSMFTNIKWKTHIDWIDYELGQFEIKYVS